MTKLSVNINKFATIRNSRGGNNPDIVKAAIDAQRFGADGVTVHPRLGPKLPDKSGPGGPTHMSSH